MDTELLTTHDDRLRSDFDQEETRTRVESSRTQTLVQEQDEIMNDAYDPPRNDEGTDQGHDEDGGIGILGSM